jgi:hypothetical protein
MEPQNQKKRFHPPDFPKARLNVNRYSFFDTSVTLVHNSDILSPGSAFHILSIPYPQITKLKTYDFNIYLTADSRGFLGI